jgi:hypothetical protein
MFIAWAADKAGIGDYVGQFAWTPSHAVWFIKQGAWSGKPEPGALVFFDWKGGDSYKGVDHVGIVERVAGKKIHTIEANVDGVWLKRKTRETDKVVGYGLPRVVKANATLDEIRTTERPFPLHERAEPPASSPFDALGGPLALLAVMIVTTVVVSFRVAGRRRRGHHRRLSLPWNAPTPTTPPRTPYEPDPGERSRASGDAPYGAGAGRRREAAYGRGPAEWSREPGEVPAQGRGAGGRAPGGMGTRVVVGAGPVRAPTRRRPYEPRG